MEDGICFSANLGDIGNDAHVEWLSIIASNGGEIAQVSGPADDSIIDADSADYLKWPVTDEQAIANANLIAAAPKLYEALKDVSEALQARIDGTGGTNAELVEMAAAREVLAKARGEA